MISNNAVTNVFLILFGIEFVGTKKKNINTLNLIRWIKFFIHIIIIIIRHLINNSLEINPKKHEYI